MTALSRWLGRLDESIDPRPLVVLRVAIGPLVLIHLMPFLERAAAGVIYRDRFWLPYADWYPHLPRELYVGVLWVAVGAGLFVSLGLLTRLAAWVCAASVAYNLFLSQTHFHHNRAFLLILLVGIAVLPVGASSSIDCLVRTPAGLSRGRGRRLALTVLRVEIALVYLASGVSKLIDADWWGGTVTRLRVVAGLERVPDALAGLLTDPGFHAWAAKVIVGTEIFIGAGLLWRRTRLAAVWVAIPFHLAIEATASVQVFSWAALAALVVWVTPTSADRHLQVPHRWQARLVQAFDWTGRFRVSTGARMELVDRNGRRRHGSDAARFAASRLPITFWVVAPLLMGRAAYPSQDTERGAP